ncbi:MAG TPA: hypothetical protein VKB93_04995, partial [Thermoanaerobaculia bacterium]|nr:hypothetical protein [Thermoanaerobaculia bacterium]
MRRVEDSGDDPERTRYEFADDEVRELMLNDAGHADSVDVITTNVSHFLGEHFGEVIDFAALIENPTSLGGLKIAPEQKPFARIGASVLRRLGGGYREVGMAIESALDQTTPGPPVNGTLAHTEPEQEPNRFRDWSGKNHPRRTRVELAAYLGDHEARKLVSQKVPKDFQEWVTGLRRWGVPVMLHGALVAARRVLRDLPGRDSRRRMAMITAAERCLSIRRREAAVNLQSHVFAEEDNTNSAVFAAQAVAYAFSSVGPIGARTEELVLGTIAAALREHRSETDLRNAIRDSLMENLLRDVSVVPDRVPEREIILVASTLIGDLSEVVQSTAYQLGERLARDGYKLMASNNLTISGYTYAAEMLGIDVESRLTEYSTKSSWWQRLWKTGPAAAIVIGDELDVFDASDDILIIGLPWTRIRPAEQPAALAYPWQNLLNEHGIATSEDVALMVDRLLAALDVAFSLAAAEVLREYLDRSDTIRATTPPSSEALDACFEFLDKRMPEHRFLAQLLVRDAFADDDHAPVFASIARQYALSTALAWLTFYIRDAARLRPTRSNRNLPTIIETLINKHPASWVEAVSGLSWDELLFRCSLPLSMFEAAERYLALERDFGPSGMPQTGRWDLDYVADRLEFIDPYARSGNEAERIVGYWLLRKDDLKIAATDLARYLAQEIARGPVTRRSPASQLLETIWRTLPRYGRSERRIIARVVSAAEVVTRDIDSQFIITSLLQERLTDAVDEIRAIDSFAQPLDGSDRMSLPVELTSFELTADELRTFLEINTAGYRMLARRLATHVVGPPALDLIASAFETASLGYDGETLAAIDATNEVASRLTASQLARLAHAINANRHLIPDPNVSARLTQLGNRLNQLRERSERLRNSTVAVIGSDPENVTQPFCRTLGALLAANDIDLVCANPTIASILIEGYRSIKADLDGAIVLRSEWDMRPMREDLPYQTIRGDLREVRQEMLARATIIIAVGGENGTRYEYRNARQLKIPVIPVASYGGATLSLYREAISDLSNLGVAAASLTPLISERNPERLAEVALVAVMEANLGLQRRSAARVEANRRAAILDTAALVAAARSVASESELVEPATIPDVMKALREGLDVDLSHARMLERRAR